MTDKRDELAAAYLRSALLGADSAMFDRLIRYSPDNGWGAVLALRRVAGQRGRSVDLADDYSPVGRLLRYHGELVIERALALAQDDPTFREQLSPLRRSRLVSPQLVRRIGDVCGWTPQPAPPPPEVILRAERALEIDIDPPRSADQWQIIDRPRTDAELHALAAAWVRRSDDQWASDAINDLVHSTDVDSAWTLILRLVHDATRDEQLWVIGAGALEDFLGLNGEAWIGRVERKARDDPKFAYALARCWRASMSEEVWQRVQRASEGGGQDSYFD